MAFCNRTKRLQRTASDNYRNIPVQLEPDSQILDKQKLDTMYSGIPVHPLPYMDTVDSYQIVNNSEEKRIKIVCISDTHNGHQIRKFSDKIRKMRGDILIHAGDFSEHGTKEEVMDAFHWLCSLDNFTYKIFISGNMDGIGMDDEHSNKKTRSNQKLFRNSNNVIYLEHNFCTVLGIKIFGCPYTPKFVGGFQYNRGSIEAEQLWNRIPDDCDILISHGPPAGILDTSSRGEQVGCQNLREAISRKSSLKVVIFGHVHHSFGVTCEDNKWFINAAQYNGIYHNVSRNEPIEFSIRSSDKSICGLMGF